MKWSGIVVAALTVTVVADGHADVLCRKRSGVVVVRTECKKKESAIDLAQFGAVGPKGDKGDPGPIEGTPAGGDLAGTYPAPTITAPPTPTEVAANPQTVSDPCFETTAQTGVYCGTSARYWRALDGPGAFGFGFWKDRLGSVHIRGSAQISTGTPPNGDALFILPPGFRPTQVLIFPAAVGSTGVSATGIAELFIYPDGFLGLFNPSTPNQPAVFIGDIQFRPDS